MAAGGRWLGFVTALIVTLGAVPTAAADGPPSCDEVPDEADARLTGSYYLATGVAVDPDPEDGGGSTNASKTGVWEDTNVLEGIQTEGGTCVDASGDQVAFDADTRSSEAVDEAYEDVETAINEAYEDVETAINEAYEDVETAINEAWATLLTLVNSLF